MRILIFGGIFPDSFARCIVAALEGMRHTVRVVESSAVQKHADGYWAAFVTLLPRAFPALEKLQHRALTRAAQDFDPEQILLTVGTVPPATIKELRVVSRGKIAAWYPDHLANLGRQYLLASDLDAWFFKDP